MSEAPEQRRIDTSILKNRIEPPQRLRGRFAVTAVLTVACAVLFVLRYVWSDGGNTDHLLRMGANYGPRVKGGEVYRLLASAFLHVGHETR